MVGWIYLRNHRYGYPSAPHQAGNTVVDMTDEKQKLKQHDFGDGNHCVDCGTTSDDSPDQYCVPKYEILPEDEKREAEIVLRPNGTLRPPDALKEQVEKALAWGEMRCRKCGEVFRIYELNEVMTHEHWSTPPKSEEGRFRFDIHDPGEPGAGLHGFTDTVEIIVESGNVGDPEEFWAFMEKVLQEWYDGAMITRAKPTPTPPESEPKGETCANCGKPFSGHACGPTHALIASERRLEKIRDQSARGMLTQEVAFLLTLIYQGD